LAFAWDKKMRANAEIIRKNNKLGLQNQHNWAGIVTLMKTQLQLYSSVPDIARSIGSVCCHKKIMIISCYSFWKSVFDLVAKDECVEDHEFKLGWRILMNNYEI
jgi:hypothetical protein